MRVGSRWTLRAGAFVLPLAVSPGTLDGVVLPKLAVAQLAAFALLGVWLWHWVVAGRSAARRTPLDLPLLAWGASAVLSTIFATNRNVAVFGTYFRYQGLVTILTCAALLWLAVQTLDTREEVRGVLRSLMAAAYIVALISVIQSLAATAASSRSGVETAFTFGGWVRASGTFGNADYLGIFLAMVLPFAVRELIDAGPGFGRLLWANVAAVMAVALLLTFSRGAWLGTVVGVAIAAISRLRVPRPREAAIVGIVISLVLVSAALMGIQNRSPVSAILARASSLADPTVGTGGTRLQIWGDTLHLIAARPVAGWGPDTFGLVFPSFQTGDWTPGAQIDRAHSDLLDVASSQGLLGVGAYLWLLGAIALAFWRGRRRQGSMAAAGAVAAYFVSMLVNFAWVPATAPFWLVLAAAVATWTQPAEDGA
ncbi:MAG: O-antigen ligase family protein, partial [Acidimicrobiaceae bacterium]|nr:O-antigen ligase family protein [Acidimicrobiaceae bacterium]